jgi:hypothetical protein
MSKLASLPAAVAVIVIAGTSLLAAPEGLDSLSDDALMNELAARNLNTLLDRAFEVNKVPPAEQRGRRTLMALSRLADPNLKLTAAQRQKLINEIVSGIEPALPSINDPLLLMKQAVVLINSGVERDVNTLEYWGENTRTQAQLRPVVETVLKLLNRCGELARKQSEELANKITAPGSPAAAQYEQMERLAATAEYNAKMVEYYHALALDRSSPQRAKVCDDAFNYLKQFDLDENPDRNIVRTRMAKLAMAKGDFDTARQYFDLVTDGTTAERKNVQVQYEARYFAAVTELLRHNLGEAKKHLDALLAWQAASLPKDKASQDGADAAAAMLRYRIASLEAEKALDPASKKAADERAVAILTELMSRRPDLRAVIYEQLLPRLGEAGDLTSADPLLLRALIAKGEEQLHRAPGEDSPDAKVIERALDAAREVGARKLKGAVDEPLADSSALLIGFFLQKLDKPVEAAGAFLDYAEQFKNANPKNANLALDNAQAIIGPLRAGPRADEPEVVKAYERFLPVAINPPFDRKQFAFEHARRLQLNGSAAEAMKYFRLVPSGDPRLLDARFFEVVARKQQLDDLPAGVDRAPLLGEIQRLADEVSRAAADAVNQPGIDDKRRGNYRLMIARTALLAADLARREQKNPERAIALLKNFESSVEGAPNAPALAADAMLIRVQSYMAAGRYSDATQELVQLLNKTEGGQGAQIVYNLLEKLNTDFERAQAAGDADQMRVLAKNRAQLSGFLVDWAANNKDANIQRFTYRYKVFDADTQRLAAVLENDPAARKAGLAKALDRFRALEAPDNVALYKASLDANAVAEPDLYDPQVVFGIARIQYDLENWRDAADRFSRLIVQRKLGTPLNPVGEDGQTKFVDNDAYWEAVYKLIRCNLKLGTGVEESKSFLKQQYITWGNRVGGRKWKDAYEQLRREIIPDFDVGPTTTPASAASSN